MLDLLIKMIKIDSSKNSGVEKLRRLIINWSKKEEIFLSAWKDNSALWLQTHPNHKKHLSFVCHLDNVPAGAWLEAFKPKKTNSIITGRGAVDDKGPLSVCLEVLKTTKKENCNVSLLIISDEETKNQDIIKVINSGKFNPDFCLVADGGENLKFDIGQKGNLWLTINVTTKGGHAAFAEKGSNAANILNQFISQLQKISQKLTHEKPFSPAFINISKLEANTEPLNMPQRATAQIQISFPPPQTAALWLKKIKQNKSIKIKIDWQSSPHLLTDKKWLKLIKKTLPQAEFITAGAPNLTHDLFLHKLPAVSHCPTRKYLAHCHNESINTVDLIKGKELYISLVKIFAKMR